MMLCIVSDIDGTIAEKKMPDGNKMAWEAAITATPPKPIIPMRTLLQAAAVRMPILYATARRETLQHLTANWLRENIFPMGNIYMRPDDLRLSQDVLKLRYLKQMREAGWQPVVWFEDDRATVEALRSQGVHAITC
jgi:hypothetical protein